VGDLLLKEVAKRIKNTVRNEDTVSRYAGDEFIVVMEKIPDIKSTAKLAKKLIDSLTAPVYINGNQLYISASIGISLFPSDGCYADTLVKAADAAMLRAKKKGRNNFQYFGAQLKAEILENTTIENAYSLYG
jgi:diguanylate cyclase (GGDEF)-like protein